GSTEWQPASPSQLGTARYLIPVDEFAEVEVGGSSIPTREEFRALCDKETDKAGIVEALQRYGQPVVLRRAWLIGGIILVRIPLAFGAVLIPRRHPRSSRR